MGNITNLNSVLDSTEFTENIIVRKASVCDIDGIMDVACSVGGSRKIPGTGFLMDDYNKNYNHFKRKFLRLIMELDYFYVVENGSILGFLIAYSRSQWLGDNPEWLEDIMWHPEFDREKTEDFVLIDKTAITSELTGKGLGSMMYAALISDMRKADVRNIFAETVVSPKPNFASLHFRLKQQYNLAGVRYEEYDGGVYTDLVYHKGIEAAV